MSAAELRQAAETLRERAKAANTDEARRPYSDPSIAPVSPEEWGALVGGDYLGGEIGDYCATLHPGVGLALADWLDSEADRRESAEQHLGSTRFMTDRDVHPFTVARLINGRAS